MIATESRHGWPCEDCPDEVRCELAGLRLCELAEDDWDYDEDDDEPDDDEEQPA